MKFEEALEQVVQEGAIRMWRVSAGWQIAYRITAGKIEARGLHKITDQWDLGQLLVSSKTYREVDGWYAVSSMHQNAEPIIHPGVEGNPGYFFGMRRKCYNCKKYRPVTMFRRDTANERGMRTWECDDCAGKRASESEEYGINGNEHVGDYINKAGHVSRPPVRGEI